MPEIVIKHGSKSYAVSVGPIPSVSDLKNRIFSLSDVPPPNQTLILKGRKIRSDSDLKRVKEKDKILLVGVCKRLSKPEINIQFKEDLKEHEGDDSLPSGLKNIENSCYMNSVIQVFKAIPEANEMIQKFSIENKNIENLLISALGELLRKMDKSNGAYNPEKFWSALLNTFNQFSTKDEKGRFRQQDAEECFSLISQFLSERIGSGYENLFKGKMVVRTESIDLKDEPVDLAEAEFKILKCHITSETDYMEKGLLESLGETIYKRGQNSATNSAWRKTSRIECLPKYLMVHFVRFFWKKDISEKVKIMRKVVFPVDGVLDVRDLCTESKVKELDAYRKAKADQMDKFRENGSTKDCESEIKGMEGGKYRLHSLITHQGPYAESGHYVAWTRNYKKGETPRNKGDSAENEWIQFDDDKVTLVSSDEIKKLSGGGEWHSALIAIFEKVE